MASPQIENGHIDIANAIADKLCSYRLSGQEWQIIWVILRKTWGWLKSPKKKNGLKKKMDRIALSQFEKMTGIDRRKCHLLLKKLIKKQVIKKSVTQKGDRFVITYGFQKNFDLWKVSPKKVTVTQKGDKSVTQKGIHKRYIKDNIADSPESATTNYYLTKSGKKLVGKKLETFEEFWEIFNYKKGKAAAADSWNKITGLSKNLSNKIFIAAKIEADNRKELLRKGQSPKWAQGWLTERRWEDEGLQSEQAKIKIPVFEVAACDR